MPAFCDIRSFRICAGPEATHYGMIYRAAVLAEVQYDRRLYLTSLAAPEGIYTDSDGVCHRVLAEISVADELDILRKARELCHQHGWTEILWVRMRKGKPHIVPIPINSRRRNIP